MKKRIVYTVGMTVLLAALTQSAEAQVGKNNSGIVDPNLATKEQLMTMPLVDASNPGERQKVQAFLDRLVERALAFGGTCTGEHGIGQGKINYLTAEHGAAVQTMIAIKKALDPLNILNPGKIFALP